MKSPSFTFESGPDRMTATRHSYGLSFSGTGPRGGYVPGPCIYNKDLPRLAALIAGDIDARATEIMESEAPAVRDYHRLAANAAAIATDDQCDARTREISRLGEARALLGAVAAARPDFTAAGMLAVAARIAERAALIEDARAFEAAGDLAQAADCRRMIAGGAK